MIDTKHAIWYIVNRLQGIPKAKSLDEKPPHLVCGNKRTAIEGQELVLDRRPGIRTRTRRDESKQTARLERNKPRERVRKQDRKFVKRADVRDQSKKVRWSPFMSKGRFARAALSFCPGSGCDRATAESAINRSKVCGICRWYCR